jgi:uncharacterized protein YjbI with pentapeptide repeats
VLESGYAGVVVGGAEEVSAMEWWRQPGARALVETWWRKATPEERLNTVQQLVTLYKAEPLPLYWVLAQATPKERRDVVLALITWYGLVDLPEREGEWAYLSSIDLSRETLGLWREQFPEGAAPWWDAGRKGVDLWAANLQGADLRGAKLQGACLEVANLKEAFLWEANLQEADLAGVNLQAASLRETNLKGAVLGWATLREGRRQPANLQKANLAGANLQEADLGGANLQGANLRYARLEGVDLTRCATLAHIHVNGVYWERTRLRWEQLGDRQEQLEEMIGEEVVAREVWSQARPWEAVQKKRKKTAAWRAEEYAAAKYGYLGLKQNFEELGDYDAASRAYRKEREMERAEAWWRRQWLKWVSDTAQWLLTDYGESVWRVLGAIMLIFAGFGVGFALTGSVVRDDGQAPTLWDYGLFSLLGMTTQDAAHLRPADPLVEAFQGLEALLAIALTGLLGFVLGNRIRHS